MENNYLSLLFWVKNFEEWSPPFLRGPQWNLFPLTELIFSLTSPHGLPSRPVPLHPCTGGAYYNHFPNKPLTLNILSSRAASGGTQLKTGTKPPALPLRQQCCLHPPRPVIRLVGGCMAWFMEWDWVLPHKPRAPPSFSTSILPDLRQLHLFEPPHSHWQHRLIVEKFLYLHAFNL